MKREYFITIVCVIVLGLQGLTSAKMPEDEVYLIFSQANQAFTRANNAADEKAAQDLYRQAILNYEKMIETGGIHNAKLYYNLANSYLLTGKLGKAILNYRRAQRLDSSDPDIYKNLNYARSQCKDRLAGTSRKKILERLFFWHYDFSIQTRFLIGGISLTVMSLWLTFRIWFAKWPAVLPVCSTMLLIFIGITTSILIEFHTHANDRSGVIVAESVMARQGDGINYPQSFNEPLHEGIEFELIESRTGWMHIKLSNGTDAWIPDQSVELI